MTLAQPVEDALFNFDNSYARLPERFYAEQAPTPMPAPRLIRVNEGLAAELGVDPARLTGAQGASVLAGTSLPPGAQPLAMAYAGHQFGGFSPSLGDGRAVLLGEVLDRQGIRRDIQLKGAGRTAFSRQGDGRAVLGPVLREYVVGEAMHALGVPTTRALACAYTGETVQREQPFPGAILARVASSHVRVGTFQYFAARGDIEALNALTDYVIARHYPELDGTPNRPLALLDTVLERQAALVAQWMLLGFIHGVMNTDNMQIAGETIDYGPCAFMDAYHPGTVYSFIDQGGRYAYANQPQAAHWNLAQLAQALVPIINADEDQAVEAAVEVIKTFPARYEHAWLSGMRAKLGLWGSEENDATLAQDLLEVMANAQADFTLTFRHLASAIDEEHPRVLFERFDAPEALRAWLERWRTRGQREAASSEERRVRMLTTNPAFIPRNHLVERAIQHALEGDHSTFETLVETLSSPYTEQPDRSDLMQPPKPEEVVHTTFCGT